MYKHTLQQCRVKACYCLNRRKIAIIMLIAFFSIAHAQGYPGDNPDPGIITMHLVNASLEKAFSIIKEQTAYRVIYDDMLLKSGKPISIKVYKAPVSKVLTLLFQDQPFNFRVIDEAIIVTPIQKTGRIILDQLITVSEKSDTIITGRILADSTFQPLSGATIVVKGVINPVITDNAGNFTLAIPDDGAVLAITHVGYISQTIHVSRTAKFPLNILLVKTAQEMDNVTIINNGYEALPKERTTGSFESISNQKLNLQVSTDILSRLQGTSSILFDKNISRPTLTLRGISSINGNKDLLVVLDNFPYEGDVNNINPNDIENITILKDAAAASIWGTRAGNGVIVITTKKGKFNQPVKIELNTNITFTEKSDLSYLQLLNPSEYIDVERFLFQHNYRFSDTNNTRRPYFSPVYEILFKQRRGDFSIEEANEYINKFANNDIRADLAKYVYKTAFNQQYSLNLKGGAQNIAYLFSGGLDKNVSELGTGFDRINFRSETSLRAFRNFRISASVLYTQSKTTSGRTGYQGLSGLYPYIPLVDENMNPAGFAKFRQPYIDTAGRGKLLDWNYYPQIDYKHSSTATNLQSFIANTSFQYQVLNNFNVSVRYQYEKQLQEQSTLWDIESYFARNLINTFSEINFTTGTVKYNVPMGGILEKGAETVQAHNLRLQADYKEKWGNNEIVFMAGSELRKIRNINNGYRIYGFDDNVLTVSNVDNVNPYPNYITKSNEYIPGGLSEDSKLNNFVSLFTNLSYNYGSRYTVTISGRRDGSNLFGATTNQKWKPLWSGGVGWNISNESFYNFPELALLNLRATYGYSGNVLPGQSGVTTLSLRSTSPSTGYPNAIVDQHGNPNLRWEKVGIFNIGIDFSTTNSIFGGSIEYYRKNSTDLYGFSPVDYTTGVGRTLFINVANMKGNGWDVILKIRPVNKKLVWVATLQFNYNKTRITEYSLSSSTASNYISDGNGITPLIGRPVYSILSYKWGGLDSKGNPQSIVEGQKTSDYSAITGNQNLFTNLAYNGPATPPLFGAVNNSFSWKHITFTANIMYKIGHSFRRQSVNYGQLFSNNERSADYSLRWKNPGDELFTNVPAMIYPNNSNRDGVYARSEVLVEKADHIRLNFINISYELKSFFKKDGMFESIQLYANGSNLGILWRVNNKGIDPEYPNTLSSIPPSKSVSIGLRTIF